jgi:hypothetical protein
MHGIAGKTSCLPARSTVMYHAWLCLFSGACYRCQHNMQNLKDQVADRVALLVLRFGSSSFQQ